MTRAKRCYRLIDRIMKSPEVPTNIKDHQVHGLQTIVDIYITKTSKVPIAAELRRMAAEQKKAGRS